jgi:hypothetical protein
MQATYAMDSGDTPLHTPKRIKGSNENTQRSSRSVARSHLRKTLHVIMSYCHVLFIEKPAPQPPRRQRTTVISHP